MTHEASHETRPKLTPVRNQTSLLSPLAKERAALIEWIVDMKCTHAITLNTNRDLSIAHLRMMFGQFCKRVDELRFGVSHVARKASFIRFDAIAFVEHPDNRPHLHVAARLDWMWLGRPFGADDERDLDWAWRNIVRGAGSTCIKEMGVEHPVEGWGRYITKDYRPGADYFLSKDFHPEKAVIQSLALQRTLAELK